MCNAHVVFVSLMLWFGLTCEIHPSTSPSPPNQHLLPLHKKPSQPDLPTIPFIQNKSFNWWIWIARTCLSSDFDNSTKFSSKEKFEKIHIFTSLPPTICWSSSLCTENASWGYYSQWWYFYLKERSSLITSRVLKYGSSRSPSLPRSTLSSSTVTGTSNLPLQELSELPLASSDSPPDSIFPQKSRRLQSTATKLRKSVCKGKGRHQSPSIPRAG